MIEKAESIFNKVFDYKWMLILFTFILIVMYYMKIQDNENFLNSFFSTPEKVPLDIVKILVMYIVLMNVITPICRYIWGLILLIPPLNTLNSNERYDEYKSEHRLLEEAAIENNSVKYNIYLAHQNGKERNLTIRKLNLSLFILILLNWKQLTQLNPNSDLFMMVFYAVLFITFISGVKPSSNIDIVVGLKK